MVGDARTCVRWTNIQLTALNEDSCPHDDNFVQILFCPFLCFSDLETARYRLKDCLKGPLNPKQPTNILFCVVFK